MTMATTEASVYTDFASLIRLKGAAREGSPESLREVARQFEAVFTQMMLKSMRTASPGDGGLLESDQSLFYRDMLDQQLALTLSKEGRLGLAEMIERQLGGTDAASRIRSAPRAASLSMTVDPAVKVPGRPAPVAADRVPVHERPAPVARPLAAPHPDMAADASASGSSSPEDFVRSMWPHAQGAARRLGVAPEVLIAQAALETGWGAAVPSFPDGRSSHNLFGIKAHGPWEGERVVNATLEFVDGLPAPRRDSFRAYRSYAESFADYADFLRSNARYQDALSLSGDGLAYVRALHRAGYATDPDYAGKIERILDGPTFDRALRGLKSAANPPISSPQG